MKITRKQAAASLFGLAAAAAQAQAAKKHKIVMEMSLAGMDAWKHAVGHIGVLRTAFKDDVQIEMVCLGEGLAVLQKTDTELQAQLMKHAEAGVVFAACQNSMRLRKVTTQDLLPFAMEVPSGLAEVVLKQEEGYSYLKLSFD
ncbi:MAG TPA: DsrE family protein [Bryobacteraceae bacterium]|nr:DsrE family protein [Bryobacteraceae bacterium]